MDEVTVVIPNSNNLSNDWFDEGGGGGLAFDGSEGGLFNGNFVPPPPRPLFLDDGVSSDGLTTCDLCSWAWQNGNVNSDTINEPPTELGWVLTLVIVSLVSALLGAIIMIIVLHCKKLKNPPVPDENHHPPPLRPPINTPDDKSPPPPFPSSPNLSGVWSWLSRRSAASPSQLQHHPAAPFAENHYTHMIEDGYNSVGDALYAELDAERDTDSASPAYQNSAYTDADAPASSAPSSAYYSDLSVTAPSAPERAYEVVGLATMPVWEPDPGRKCAMRLEAISETNVPSDYV